MYVWVRESFISGRLNRVYYARLKCESSVLIREEVPGLGTAILGTVRSVALSLFASRLVKRELSSRQTATGCVVFLRPSADVTGVIGSGSTLLARYTPSLACPVGHDTTAVTKCTAATRRIFCHSDRFIASDSEGRKDGLVMAVKDDHFGKRVSFSLYISTLSSAECRTGGG